MEKWSMTDVALSILITGNETPEGKEQIKENWNQVWERIKELGYSDEDVKIVVDSERLIIITDVENFIFY